MEPLTTLLDVIIYEPSKYFQTKSTTAPKMNLSHLILMGLKLKLEKFTRLRLQKTAYFTNLVEFTFAMEKATELVNRIKTDKELELLATVCFILGAKIDLRLDDILLAITVWSQEKVNKFSPQSVQRAISFLINENLIYINLMGYYKLGTPSNQVKTNTLVKYETVNLNGSLNFKGRDF